VSRAVEMLLVVHVDEVDEEEVGFIGGDEKGGHAGAEIVVDVVAIEGAVDLFEGRHEARGAKACVEEDSLFCFGIAVLGEVVVDLSTNGDGPGDGGGGEALLFGDGVESRALDLLGVPVPGTVETMFGVEHDVGEDAVKTRRDAGDESGVAGIGDSGVDAQEAVGEGSALCEFVEVGGVETAGR
jgi:hypothetical protein